jgi:hypothetical protein
MRTGRGAADGEGQRVMDIREAESWLQSKLNQERERIDNAPKRLMTDDEKQQIKSLSRCVFLPASYDKRFVADMTTKPDDYEISERQALFIGKLYHRYRRQHGYK